MPQTALAPPSGIEDRDYDTEVRARSGLTDSFHETSTSHSD